MLELQKFLIENNNALDLLKEDPYNLDIKQHNVYPNLYLFKYNQIESNKSIPLVQESRGIILDKNMNWGAVAYPYKKFFNFGESNAAVINWDKAVVYEKLDGSCCTLYWYNGKWNVSTLGVPDASGPVRSNDVKTFADLFWEAFNLKYKLFQLDKYKSFCFMFELMTPENRVVVPHTEYKIVLHGVRNLITLEEIDISNFKHLFDIPKIYSLKNINECAEIASTLNPMQNEGFVIVDDRYNRVKVKNPQYVAIAHIKDNWSHRRIIQLVQANETDEFLVYYPEFQKDVDDVRALYNSLKTDILKVYDEIKGIEVQKDFALQSIKYPFSDILFQLRSKRIESLDKYVSSLEPEKMEKLLKRYKKENL